MGRDSDKIGSAGNEFIKYSQKTAFNRENFGRWGGVGGGGALGITPPWIRHCCFCMNSGVQDSILGSRLKLKRHNIFKRREYFIVSGSLYTSVSAV